jgi:hypothetical protein
MASSSTYVSCGRASGWMTYTRSGQPCAWDKPIHQLLYSTKDTAARWDSDDIDVADTLVIYAR